MFNSVDFYKCLSDHTRLKSLLLIVHEGEVCVCELMSALLLSQPKVSRHLSQLRNTNIVVDRKYKQWVFYSLNPNLPDWVIKIIRLTYQHNQSYISFELERLNKIGNRPERISICCEQ